MVIQSAFFILQDFLMKKTDFKHYICLPFCVFFREGEKEEMACQGALVIEELIRKGVLKSNELPGTGKDPELWEKHDESLEIVCGMCPFKPEDCDFHPLRKDFQP